MNINFKDKNVLITGGSRGIGRELVNTFSNLEANVVYTSTKDLNFINKLSVNNFLDRIKNISFDICINNAGINTNNNFCDIKDVDWNDIINVNLTGCYKICKAVSKQMINQRSGKIINVASIWGNISKQGRAAYSASKFGVRGLTLGMAAELAQYNILVNSVSPGFTITELTKKTLGVDGMNKIKTQIPLNRLATTKDISNAILFLCSDLNTYISGHDLVVDGGFCTT